MYLPGEGQKAKAGTPNITTAPRAATPTPQPVITLATRCLTVLKIDDTLIWIVNVWILWRSFHSLSHFSFKVIPQYTRKVEILFGKKKKINGDFFFSVSEKKTDQKIFPHLPYKCYVKLKNYSKT